MKTAPMSRRKFIQSTTIATVAATSGPLNVFGADVSWPIGCFNRPWMQKFSTRTEPVDKTQISNWGFDVALKGIKEAGYKTVGLLTNMPDEPFTGRDASDDYLD